MAGELRVRRKLAPKRREVRKPVEPALYQFPPLESIARHTFGFSAIRWRLSQIACLNSQTVVFPIGCGLYKHSDHCSVPVLPVQASTERISCVAVAESGLLMAVCEKHKLGEFSTVSVYDMRKDPSLFKRYFTRDDKEIGNVGFSKDDKEIVVLCSTGSSSVLYCWDTDLPRPRFTIDFPHHVNRIAVSWESNDVFSVSGPGILKMWSLAEEDVQSGKYDNEITGLELPGTGIMETNPETGLSAQKLGTGIKCTLTDHVWLVDNSMAVSTEEKVIFIVRDMEIKYTFLATGHILCLASTPTGFFAGRKDGVIMQILGWDIVASEYSVRSKNPYVKVKCSYVARESLPITTLVVAPNDKSVVYIVEAEKIGRLQLNEKFEDGTDIPIMSYNEEADIYGPVLNLVDFSIPVFTMAPVVDMDICRSRMNIVTSHQDQVVRIWSYARLVCDWTYQYDEEVFAVTIRNYHLLVAFFRTIKIFFITADKYVVADYIWFSEIRITQINDVNLRNVRQMRFSPSGHLLAVAAGRDVILINTSWKIIATLKGHQGIITSVTWSHDSIYLSSGGLDGAVHSWFMDGFNRYAECVTIGTLYSCVLYDGNRKYIYGCGPNIPLRAVDTDKKYWFPQILPENVEDDGLGPDQEEEDPSGSCWEHHIFRAQTSFEAVPKGLTRIAGLFNHELVCGTNEDGGLLLYSVPLSKGCLPVWEEKIYAGKIICLSTDENYDLIVMASSQASILMLTLRKLPWSKDLPDRPPSPRGFLPVDELSLVDILATDKDQLEESQKYAQDFTKKIQKERNEMLYRDHMREQEFIIQMRELDESKAKKISEYELRLRLLEKRFRMTESEKEVSIQQLLENQEITLKEMNDEFEKKIIKESDKAHNLRTKLQNDNKRVEEIMNERQRAYDLKLEEMRKELEGAQQAADKKLAEVRAQCDHEIAKYRLSFDMELMTNDEEVQQALRKYKKDLDDQKKRVEDVFGQLSYEKNIILQSQATINKCTAAEAEYEDKLYDTLLENWRLKKLVVAIDKDRARTKGLLVDSDERNESILANLRDQESYHTINDYKITKLRMEKQPVNAEIRRLRKYVGDLESLQAGNLRDLRDLRIVEAELKKVIAANAVTLKQMLDQVLTLEISINNFTAKLTQIIEENEMSKWPDMCKDLYDTYVRDKHRQMNADCLAEKTEMRYQRTVLEKFVKILDMAILRIDKEHAFAANRLVQKNLALLNGFSEANRNVERLNSILKELQGEEAYFRAVAAKHRYVTMASLQRMSQTRQSKITKASMSSQIHTKAKGAATPGEPQRYSSVSETRSAGSGYEVLNKSRRSARVPPDSAMTEPGKTATKTKKEKPRAKSSIARFGSIAHPDHPLELLATEKELKNKEKDIEMLQKNLERISVKAQKSPAPS